MDILVGRIAEPGSGGPGSAQAGAAVGTVLAIRRARRGADRPQIGDDERRRRSARMDPPRAVVLTILIEDPGALQGPVEPGVTRAAVRILPRTR